MKQPKSIILVCVGNKCRSVAAEDYMTIKLKERNYEGIDVSSAGVATSVGGRQFTQNLGDKADLLIAIDESVAYSLGNSFHQPPEKITTLRIRDDYDEDPNGLRRELDRQLLPIIDLYFPKR